MRSFIRIVLLLLLPCSGIAQDTVITISPNAMKSNFIALGNIDGWIFRKGNDISWAAKEIGTAGWQ